MLSTHGRGSTGEGERCTGEGERRMAVGICAELSNLLSLWTLDSSIDVDPKTVRKSLVRWKTQSFLNNSGFTLRSADLQIFILHHMSVYPKLFKVSTTDYFEPAHNKKKFCTELRKTLPTFVCLNRLKGTLYAGWDRYVSDLKSWTKVTHPALHCHKLINFQK